MIKFLNIIYDDEILYSVMARYQKLTGSTNYKETVKDFFYSNTITTENQLPCSFKYSPICYDYKYLINHCTILPIYIPFLSNNSKNKIFKELGNCNGKMIYNLLGVKSGKLLKVKSLKYCPLCAIDNKVNYGEAYFHRIHQVDGIKVCPLHGCLIKDYLKQSNKLVLRLEFISLDTKNIDLSVEYEIDNEVNEKLNLISKSISYLLDNNLYQYNIEKVHKKYMLLLDNKGFLSNKSKVRQKKLIDEFRKYYKKTLLRNLNCDFNDTSEYCWIKCITRKQNKIVQPIKHILFILFLCNGDIESFFKNDKFYKPFGKGPWYCLNPAAEHYHKKVITQLSITDDYKTRKPVGTFTCSCGFIYSRKGPDRNENDAYKIGRIKKYGQVWENKLKDLIISSKYGIRQLGRLMGCDPKTVVKYAKKLDLEYYIESSMDINIKARSMELLLSVDYEQTYKNKVTSVVNENPDLSRIQIRNIIQKEYTWLYRHDRKWLYSNLPEKINKKGNFNKYNQRVDWDKRDKEILMLIQAAYNQEMQENKLIRITKSLLGQLTGESVLLNNYIEKLPRTKQYISSIVETIEAFQIRRLEIVSRDLYKEKGYLKKWEVIRRAGLRPNFVLKLDGYINKIIGKYNMNN